MSAPATIVHPDIVLDEATHTYYVDGVEVLGVTRIIDDILQEYRDIDPEALRRAQIRGTHAHHATEMHDLGTLDYGSLTEEIGGYVEAYIAFLNDTGFVPDLIEPKVNSVVYGYAGTADRLGRARGQRRRWLPDLKTALVLPKKSIGLQTAAYENALREMGCIGRREQIERKGLQLLPKRAPPYKLTTLENVGDFHDFLALKRAYQLKRRSA